MIKYSLACLGLAFGSVEGFAQQSPPAMMVGPQAENILRAGTPIFLRTVHEITTKGKHLAVGDRFTLEVDEAVSLNGQVIIPAGSPAVGEITSIRNKGMWGKSGNIETRLLYVMANGRRIRLEGMGAADKGSKAGGGAIVTSAVFFLPIGFFWTGTSAVVPPGTKVNALIGEDVPILFAGQPGITAQNSGAFAGVPATPVMASPAAAASEASPTQWRQVSYSPGVSIAFVDTGSIRRTEQSVRFWASVYYPPSQGSDHAMVLREANCEDRSYRDINTIYLLGSTHVRTVGKSADPSYAAPGSVNEEMIRSACGTKEMGNSVKDPSAVAASFFSSR